MQSNVWPRQAKKLRDATRGFEKSGAKPRTSHEQDLRVSHSEELLNTAMKPGVVVILM